MPKRLPTPAEEVARKAKVTSQLNSRARQAPQATHPVDGRLLLIREKEPLLTLSSPRKRIGRVVLEDIERDLEVVAACFLGHDRLVYLRRAWASEGPAVLVEHHLGTGKSRVVYKIKDPS